MKPRPELVGSATLPAAASRISAFTHNRRHGPSHSRCIQIHSATAPAGIKLAVIDIIGITGDGKLFIIIKIIGIDRSLVSVIGAITNGAPAKYPFIFVFF